MANQNLPFLQPNRDDIIKQQIAEERLFQASFSFKLASIATIMFALISLFGVGLFLSGHLPAGSLIAASGVKSTVHFLKLAKDANDRLDRIFEELKAKSPAPSPHLGEGWGEGHSRCPENQDRHGAV
jgi:uncharacterized membrane protein YbhN (UPF0104 family)